MTVHSRRTRAVQVRSGCKDLSSIHFFLKSHVDLDFLSVSGADVDSEEDVPRLGRRFPGAAFSSLSPDPSLPSRPGRGLRVMEGRISMALSASVPTSPFVSFDAALWGCCGVWDDPKTMPRDGLVPKAGENTGPLSMSGNCGGASDRWERTARLDERLRSDCRLSCPARCGRSCR